MSAPPLKVGLAGCGRAAERFYLPAFSALADEAMLIAVADPLPERAEFAAGQLPGLLTFPSVDALFDQADLDALIVTTPPATHLPIATQALRGRLPVLVEKPLARTIEEAREIEELAAHTSVSIMVGFNQRHWDPVRQLQMKMRDEELAGGVAAELEMTTDIVGWSAISAQSDPLEDLAPHLLDLVRFILGCEIETVQASSSAAGAFALRVSLSGGRDARCRVAHGNATDESILVHSNRRDYRVRMGSERIEPAAGVARTVLDFSDAVGRRLRGKRSSIHDSYRRQLQQFFHSVRTKQQPTPCLGDGLAAVRAVDAARRSLANGGKEVAV